VSAGLDGFLAGFVEPLLAGKTARVGRPLRFEEFRAMAGALASGRRPTLEALRQGRAQGLIAEPALAPPGDDELALWIGLHNVLALDHPDRPRVWARQISWRRVEAVTRHLLARGQAEDFEAALARHVAVGPFVELLRRDSVVLTVEGEERFSGQPVPRRRVRFGRRDEVVHWLSIAHADESGRLIPDVLWASPITCALRPTLAPEGWSPLMFAPFLFERGFARAVCHAWAASKQWIEAGGAVMGALWRSLAPPVELDTIDEGRTGERRMLPAGAAPLALSGSSFAAGPREIGAIVGVLIHLHFIKVLELGARLGVATATRSAPVQMFLALPLLAPALAPALGSPMAPPSRLVGFEGQVARRWSEYADHIAEVLPREVVENLRATLVPRIVKETAQP
jgi:hypothetical protein